MPLSKSPKPFLKWAGSKSQSILQLKKYIPKEFDNYFEPFLGGGSLFFYLKETHPNFTANLGDLNIALIETYGVVRDKLPLLIRELEQYQALHSKEFYYKCRGLNISELELNKVFYCDYKRAARFIYLNKTCYNGLYRENKKGRFNVPIGGAFFSRMRLYFRKILQARPP